MTVAEGERGEPARSAAGHHSYRLAVSLMVIRSARAPGTRPSWRSRCLAGSAIVAGTRCWLL